MSFIDLLNQSIGKKIYVLTEDEGKKSKTYGILASVDGKFIILDTNNPNFYLNKKAIVIDNIEEVGVLSGSPQNRLPRQTELA